MLQSGFGDDVDDCAKKRRFFHLLSISSVQLQEEQENQQEEEMERERKKGLLSGIIAVDADKTKCMTVI